MISKRDLLAGVAVMGLSSLAPIPAGEKPHLRIDIKHPDRTLQFSVNGYKRDPIGQISACQWASEPVLDTNGDVPSLAGQKAGPGRWQEDERPASVQRMEGTSLRVPAYGR